MGVKSEFEAIRLNFFLPYQISILADELARRTMAIAKEHGLNQSSWRVLAALADQPGITANEVVDMTPMDKGIVSRAVKSLIEDGMVIRKASNDDGRIAHLYLTAKGNRNYIKTAEKVLKLDKLLSDCLSSNEQKVIAQSIDKLVSALKERNSASLTET